MMRGKALLLAVTFMTLVLSATITSAKFAMTHEPVPVDRLIGNTEKYIKDSPQDAKGYYTLGRLQSLAYALDGGQVDVERDSKNAALPTFPRYNSVLDASRDPDKPLNDTAKKHLLDAI